MKRRMIKIDEEKCNGCGLCSDACHEGAIGMVDGKARLMRDDYCDGLGDCLPVCPTGAIAFEEREAPAYDTEAVRAHMAASGNTPSGCPGANAHAIRRGAGARGDEPTAEASGSVPSRLAQWPVQIKLAPQNAPYFNGANLLIAADCTAFSFGDFHERFMKNRITLIGCPKLDDGDYADKLTAILRNNDVRSVAVVRMEVPCCGGIVNAVKTALQNSGKMIPWQVVTLSTDGLIIEG